MTLLSNWHFMRILRAVVAIWGFTGFVQTGDWMLFGIAALFGLQAVFDVGCCGPSGCATPARNGAEATLAKEVEYEEIKAS